MINKKFYYKITTDKMKSIFLTWAIQYKLNEKTYPVKGNGPCAVFDTSIAAYGFMQGFCSFFSGIQNFKMFKCEIKKSRRKTLWYCNRGKKFRKSSFTLPTGTVLADWVKLVKEIKE